MHPGSDVVLAETRADYCRTIIRAAGELVLKGFHAADKPLVGLVSIAATEANNVRYINGAKKAAGEFGYEVSVVDAAGSADQANAAIQNFVQRGAFAIADLVFPASSIGAGLDAAKQASIPVVTCPPRRGAYARPAVRDR